MINITTTPFSVATDRTPAGHRAMLARARTMLDGLVKAYRLRCTIGEVGRRDDRLLRDIGLDRADIDAACRHGTGRRYP